MSSKNIVTLIMAAGSSSRMGEPKQLLRWKSATLIEDVITKALQLTTTKTIVVLGANEAKILSKIKPYPIEIIHNEGWHMGLGNSIAFGVNHIQNNYNVDGIFIVLADQPLIDTTYLKGMIDSFENGKDQIITTQYQNGYLGVPVLFDKNYFKELAVIDGDKGAKLILDKYSDSVTTIQLIANVFDVDTKKDYNFLNGN